MLFANGQIPRINKYWNKFCDISYLNQTMKKEHYKLCLYIAGHSQKALRAITNLQKITEEELEGRYTVEIIDLLEHPQLAEGDQIIAVPTLIKKLPAPLRAVVGDLSDKVKVLVGLNIKWIRLGLVFQPEQD